MALVWLKNGFPPWCLAGQWKFALLQVTLAWLRIFPLASPRTLWHSDTLASTRTLWHSDTLASRTLGHSGVWSDTAASSPFNTTHPHGMTCLQSFTVQIKYKFNQSFPCDENILSKLRNSNAEAFWATLMGCPASSNHLQYRFTNSSEHFHKTNIFCPNFKTLRGALRKIQDNLGIIPN